MIKELPSHPYADLFPLRAGNTLIELSDHMKLHGQIEDVVIYQGMVLDGRRRQLAAIRAGLVPRYREFGNRPGDGTDPLEFAFSVNYHRRDDMTEAEKVLAAVGYANHKRGQAQAQAQAANSTNPANAGLGGKPISQKEAAKKFRVSEHKVERAKAVVDKGVEELKEAVRTEAVSISDAASIVGEPEDVQRQAVAMVLAGEAETLKEAVKGLKPKAPPPAVKPGRVGKLLDEAVELLGHVDTEQLEARDLALAGLRAARALVAKL